MTLPVIDTSGRLWTVCRICAAAFWSAIATLCRDWERWISYTSRRSVSAMAVCLEREMGTIKERYSEIRRLSWKSNYLQNSSAEKCSFQNVPGSALVSDILYVTFKPFVEEQSAKTIYHHLGRDEMNLLLFSHRTIPLSSSTHPEA